MFLKQLNFRLSFIQGCAIIMFLAPIRVLAQEEVVIPRASGYSLGLGMGIATMYGDLNKHISTFGGRIGLARHLTNSLLLDVEYYSGSLSSEETPNTWTTGLKSSSKFFSVDINAKVNLSVLFSNTETPLSRFISGFYIGSGIGYVDVTVNNITESINTRKPLDTSLRSCIKKHDVQPYLPLNIGYRYQLKNFLGANRTQIMMNLNMCYTYSDYIDGYNLSTINKVNKSNRFNDVYSLLTLGFSYALTSDDHSARSHHRNNNRLQKEKTSQPKPTKKQEHVAVPEFKQSIID